MFRCDNRRMAWYLDRGLAVKLQDDPPAIRLTFKPKGPGHGFDPYFTQEFLNRCTVCGSEKDLTHHHIVPYAYRRHFPRESYELGRWMYDVLLLCTVCHHRYEGFGDELRDTIAREHGVPASGITNLKTDQLRAMKASAALDRHRDKMPLEKRAALEATLKGFLKKEELLEEDYRIWHQMRNAIETIPSGKIVAELLLKDIAAIDDFAIRWRRHFIAKMKPGFLPQGWNPERRVYSEPDVKDRFGDEGENT